MPSFSAEERQLLNDSLVDYLGAEYGFDTWKRVARAPDGEGFSREQWMKYAELGWLGVNIPEASGGAGGGITELGIVMAGAGRFLLLEPFLGTIVLGAAAIERAGTPAQQALLADIAAGKLILAFCHTEPDSGYARHHVAAIARAQGGGWIIDGEKGFALHAHAADTLVVTARIGSATGPIALFLVPRTAEGVRTNPAPALDGRRGATVSLSGVRVAGDAKLGAGDADQSALIDDLMDRGCAAVCAEACGAMATVSQRTLDYLKTRQQFGQPLAKFQVLQHRLVDMSVSAEEARATTHAALQAIDDRLPDARRTVWHAKVQMVKSARFVGGQGIQLHGGMGMTDELEVGHYYKRLAQCETLFGDGEWYLRQIGAAAAR